MADTVAKLIDTTTCIGCKACEAACQEWNDNGFAAGSFDGTYQTMPETRHDFWNLIQFREVEHDVTGTGGTADELGATSVAMTAGDGTAVDWLFAKYQCMHCVDAGCMAVCPAPGAIFRHGNGTVDFDHDICIGCGYCIAGCPFDIPRLSPVTQVVYKCTLCSDRTAVGLEPACVKACPTSCLTYGTREQLLRDAENRVETLRARGEGSAGIYNPAGVGGTNVLYVLKDASRPQDYGLPASPEIHWTVRLWQGPVKWLGGLALLGGVVGAALHYLRFGPMVHEGEVSGTEQRVTAEAKGGGVMSDCFSADERNGNGL